MYSPMGRSNFKGEGKGATRYKVQRHSAVICAKTAEPIETSFGLWTQAGPRKDVLDWAQIPYAKGQSLRERTCPGMLDDILP